MDHLIATRAHDRSAWAKAPLIGLATIVLLLVPFIPGLRDIPRLIPIHRLIWCTWDSPAPLADAGTAQVTATSAGPSRS